MGDDTLTPSPCAQALSPRSSLVLTAPAFIKRGDKGFGFLFKAVRVYIGETNNYRLHHIVEVCVGGGGWRHVRRRVTNLLVSIDCYIAGSSSSSSMSTKVDRQKKQV